MPQTILIIDDSPEIHTLVKIRLNKEDVKIASALDAESGLAMAHDLRPDLILLDVEMPDRNGFDVCRDLKDDPATVNTPIIFLTGATSADEKIKGLELGATDYITKPFDPAELRARVRGSLRTKYLFDLLAKKAMVDGLTALWNRTYLDARLSNELSAARRTGHPLSCIMADIDRFKSVNDTYGHAFGDEVLRNVAATLTANCRDEDILCRYGGEEFAILLPNTSVQRAVELAERFRAAIASSRFVCGNKTVDVTASFGVADLRGTVPPSVLELADEALYRAKHAGRNRVEQAPSSNAVAA